MRTFIPAFFFALGTSLIVVGILFHYKNRKDYGAYFFFAGVCLFLGVVFS
jgi:hypothetical protein